MSKTIHEAARDIPVLEAVDVLVAGGGVAGCAAAYSAAKAGAKTLMVERNGCLGGVATASLMANVGNHYVTSAGEQVIHGFASQVLDRMVAAGAASPLWKSPEVPGCVIDSERLKVVLIEMLEEAGVAILTHTMGVRPILERKNILGAFIESKSGRQAILAKATVDCTGDADLAAQAGTNFRMSWRFGNTLFKLANVDLDAFVAFLNVNPGDFPARQDGVRSLEVFNRNWKERGILFFPHHGGEKWRFLQDLIARGEFQKEFGVVIGMDLLGMYARREDGFVVINSNLCPVEDLDIRNLSRFELATQKACYRVADLLKRWVPGFQHSHVAHVGVDLGIRSSRIIEGRSVLKGASLRDAQGPQYFDDVIATVPVLDTRWATGDWRMPYTCDVPFGITVPLGCDNLLMGSGKCVSTQPPRIIRGMSGCMIFGQATGVASAMAARDGIKSADVPIRKLQKELLRQGVRLGEQKRLKELGLG